MLLSTAQVESAIQEANDDDGFWHNPDYYPIDINGTPYNAVVVERGGGMDESSNAFVVFRLGNQIFRKHGFYASHYGYDWDGTLEEVFAQERIVTVYEPR